MTSPQEAGCARALRPEGEDFPELADPLGAASHTGIIRHMRPTGDGDLLIRQSSTNHIILVTPPGHDGPGGVTRSHGRLPGGLLNGIAWNLLNLSIASGSSSPAPARRHPTLLASGKFPSRSLLDF